MSGQVRVESKQEVTITYTDKGRERKSQIPQKQSPGGEEPTVGNLFTKSDLS